MVKSCCLSLDTGEGMNEFRNMIPETVWDAGCATTAMHQLSTASMFGPQANQHPSAQLSSRLIPLTTNQISILGQKLNQPRETLIDMLDSCGDMLANGTMHTTKFPGRVSGSQNVLK